jgi:ribosome biogenesis GTPase A
MLKTQSGKRQREKLKNARATARSMHTTAEGHVREVVEEPAHDFRFKGAVGKGSLLETVFHVREAGYEVEKRVVESRAPLVRTSTSTGSDSYYAETIPIPSRPAWDPRATAQQVQEAEDEAFEEYLQRIYEAYPPYRLNHFEHNLHVWRQLWRVVDISDILVLVADARHPQFHVPPSLYDYIVHQCRKPMLCVLNKIDFISSANLAAWIADFKQRFPLLTVVPFSSFPHEKTITNPDADVKQEKKRKAIQHEKNKAGGVKGMPPPYGIENLLRVLEEVYRAKQERDGAPDDGAAASGSAAAAAAVPTATGVVGGGVDPNWRPSRVKKSKAAFAKARAENRSAGAVDSEQLMATLKQLGLNTDVEADAKKLEAGGAIPEEAEEESEEESEEAADVPKSKITVGTIGHPNVGKSSLINALIGRAAVTVSETPGKTKHLQTLALNDRMELCDCPGL